MTENQLVYQSTVSAVEKLRSARDTFLSPVEADLVTGKICDEMMGISTDFHQLVLRMERLIDEVMD